MTTPEIPLVITAEELAELRALKVTGGVSMTPQTPKPDIIIDSEGNAAVVDKPKEITPPWPHRTMEFAGSVLQVRKPSGQALVAFSIASGGIDPEMQMKIFRTFLQKHLSPSSFGEVLLNMMDPDGDEGWGLGELLKALVTMPDTEAAAPETPAVTA